MRVSDDFLALLQRVILAALLILAVLAVTNASAQNLGTVGLQAQEVPVFSINSFSTVTHSQILNDQGQGLNILFFCGTSAGFTGSIDLEWTPSPVTPASTFYPLVTANYSNLFATCHSIQVGGYWPNIRSTVTPSGTGVLGVWYSSISGAVSYIPPALGSNGPSSPIACDKNATISAATGATTIALSPANLNDTVIVCGESFSFSAAPTGGSVALQWGTTALCGSLDAANWTLTTIASTPQVVPNPIGLRSSNTLAKNYLCINNTSGVTVQANFSYASVQVP
jgi:hypothetical protein